MIRKVFSSDVGGKMNNLLLIISFFLVHMYLERYGLSEPLAKLSLFATILAAIGLIAAAIVLSVWLGIGGFFSALMTILLCSVIAYKYRKKFEI